MGYAPRIIGISQTTGFDPDPMIRRALILPLLLALPTLVRGQATPRVAPDEPVYRDIDRLAAAGLIDTLIVGVRPFSEREVVRLLTEARRNVGRLHPSSAWAEQAIARDLARFSRVDSTWIDGARVELSGMNSPYRAAPSDANGSINAGINPLASNRLGRPLANGATASFETMHDVRLGERLAISLSPRLTTQRFAGGHSNTELTFQTASINALLGNVSIEAGREYAIFGQSPLGGLLFSENSPSLDMLRIGNDHAFVLPWLFRLAGPLRASVLVADPGVGQLHPHAKLAAYHVAALPTPHLELGFEVLDAMGGQGGQPASFGDRVLDAIPVIDVLFRARSDFLFSNKIAGGDFHWRMPSWNGFELYGETVIDDFDVRRLRSVFLDDGGYIVGTALSCITECGRLGVRAEYHQTGIRMYTHDNYPIASHGLVVGDPLGPRGLGAYLTIDGESVRAHYVAVTTAFEVRSGNTYTSGTTGVGSTGFHFVQTSHRPAEKRGRVSGTWTTPALARGIETRATLGVERVSSYAFVNGSNRTNWLANLAFVYRP
jgi:hypothetical protein